MKKTGKMMMTLLLVLALMAGLIGCGKQEEKTEADQTGTTTEEENSDYNVEEDLVEGVLTEDMLDKLEEEEATTEEEKKEEDKKASLNKYYIKVNRQTNVVTVYTYDDNGNYTKPVKAFVCSTGSGNGTPTGKFKLSGKYRWQLMNGGVYSQYASRITGHILFHSVPYNEMKNNTLITRYYNQLGRQASAGCVRLTCADAKWIYSNCPSGTVVEIFDGTSANDPLGKPGSITISTSSPYRGWDPTDADPDNPWKTAKPTITAENFTVELGSGNVDLVSKAKAVDAYGQSLKVTVSGNVNTKAAGTYSITYSATDSRGNSAKKSITATVKDSTKPVIKWNASSYKYEGQLDADSVKTYIRSNISVSDIAGTENPVIKVPGEIDKASGKINCTVTVKDNSGNVSTLTIVLEFEKEIPEDSSTEDTSTNTATDTIPGSGSESGETIETSEAEE